MLDTRQSLMHYCLDDVSVEGKKSDKVKELLGQENSVKGIQSHIASGVIVKWEAPCTLMHLTEVQILSTTTTIADFRRSHKNTFPLCLRM